MPKYWEGNYFAHVSFPEVGQKQKTEKKRERERKKTKVGDNSGQATHGARKPHGACKPPGPIVLVPFSLGFRKVGIPVMTFFFNCTWRDKEYFL